MGRGQPHVGLSVCDRHQGCEHSGYVCAKRRAEKKINILRGDDENVINIAVK